MRPVFLAFLVLCCSAGFAQHTMILKGDAKLPGNKGGDVKTTLMAITDKNIYDKDGNILDSATAVKMLRTYEYHSGWSIPKGQTELKRTITPNDPEEDAKTDKYLKLAMRPQSPKLWEGVTLDLKPLAKRTDLAKLEGKAIILIFWCSGCYRTSDNAYEEINYLTTNYIDKGNLEVFAITHQPYDVAIAALKTSPILNAHNVIDAPGITDAYQTDEKPIIVVTDTKHRVTYAMTGWAAMTPRIVNGLLKSL